MTSQHAHAARVNAPTVNERVRTAIRPGHRLIDSLFYNTLASDAAQFGEFVAIQGSVIFVPADPGERFKPFPDVLAFRDDSCRGEVGAISVSGVGSSSVGAVGFARDVAQALNTNVAAVVCGYGMNDLIYEAVGGAVFLRRANEGLFLLEQMQHSITGGIAGMPGLLEMVENCDSVGAGPDLGAMKMLLRSRKQHLPNLRYVVGHSKGNLVISGALSELGFEEADAAFDDLTLILFSALVAVPDEARQVHQFIGSLDALGWMNSRLNVPYDPVVGAMHHLNRSIPFYLDAVGVMESVVGRNSSCPQTA